VQVLFGPTSDVDYRFERMMILCNLPKKMGASYPSIQRWFSNQSLPTIVASNHHELGEILLNKPRVLNALDLEMVRSLQKTIDGWVAEGMIRAFFMEGAGGKAFCAGGDVARVRRSHLEDSNPEQHGKGLPGLLTTDFFREEYQMNYSFATLPIPQISLWDGIVMGGGVGASVHGKFRVATENALFAMPETAIGLFPDVGGSYFLSRLPGGLGQYLALTGARLRAADLLYSGIATHYIKQERLEELKTSVHDLLQEDASAGEAQIAHVLDTFSSEPEHGKRILSTNREPIDRCFASKESVEEILKALTSEGTEWAGKTGLALSKMSPTSLKVTHRLLEKGGQLNDIGECLKMEFRVVQGFMRPRSDFYEGIRAILVEKDLKPAWNPKSLKDVSEDIVVGSFFKSLGEHELALTPWSSKK